MPADPQMKLHLRRPGRPKPWVCEQAASISPTGRPRAKWFKTKELGLKWAEEEGRRLRKITDKTRNFTEDEKLEMAAALPIAREGGFSILVAVREKLERVTRERASIPLPALVEEVLAQLALEKKSRPHIDNARYVGRKLATEFPGALVCNLTTNALQDWLAGLSTTMAPATLKQHRRYVSLFCEYARRRGYLAINPARDVRLAYRDQSTVSILTPEQVKALLAAAAPGMRPYFALCAFAGLRPAEAQRLRWANVGETIYVDPQTAKTRRHRHVTITPNLRAWLDARPAEKTPGLVYWTRKQFRAAVAAATGIEEWPQDVLRHSFGTYWLALHEDENKLALQMGNSPSIIHSHYRVPVSKEAAAAYFNIFP